MILLEFIKFGQPGRQALTLRIMVPETLSFNGVFEDALQTYCSRFTRTKIKTAEFGTLFEMVYVVRLRKAVDEKAFLDALRAQNANLSISLTQREYDFGY